MLECKVGVIVNLFQGSKMYHPTSATFPPTN